MYRAVGLKALRLGISVRSEPEIAGMLAATRLDIVFNNKEQHILLDGEDVSDLIRTPQVSLAASDVSALPVVRLRLVELQREIASRQSLVLDGRDIGSYVLPDARCKFFLTASEDERARRRLRDLQARGDQHATLDEIRQDIAYRDRQDSQRSLAPLCQAPDAILVDTTDMTIDQVVDAILNIIRQVQNEPEA